MVQMLRPWNIHIQLDTKPEKAVYLSIADGIIEQIRNGNLSAGDVLPGSRIISKQLNVNRKTIIKSLDLLLAEGWLYSEERKGLFVAGQLSQEKKVSKAQVISRKTVEAPHRPLLSFDCGQPDITIAPMEDFAKAYRRIFSQNVRFNQAPDTTGMGLLKLREALSQMLNQKRGMCSDASQICVTRGGQMALFLTARVLFREGGIVIVENPGYGPGVEAFREAGAEVIPVAVDKNGIDVDRIGEIVSRKKVKAVYVTPHHQYPTTVMLSLKRRLKLAELSNRYGFTLIEDDYDSEFHFGQRPVMPICAQIKIEHSVYIGTFSKMISSTLRAGYLASDSQFVEKVAALRRIIDMQGDNIMESTIVELLDSGVLQRHVRRVTKIYKTRRDIFASLLDIHLKDKVTYRLPEGGMAFWLKLNEIHDLHKFKQRLRNAGLAIISPDDHWFGGEMNGIRIGYASLNEEIMEKGILILKKVLGK